MTVIVNGVNGSALAPGYYLKRFSDQSGSSIAQASAINFTTATPPAAPSLGDAYVVATGGTGAWAGKDGQIAVWQVDVTGASNWAFYVPQQGWSVYDQATSTEKAFNGSSWATKTLQASAINFQQSGTGAVARTVQDELQNIINVKQFGAKGDGVTDDTSAINAAYTAAEASGGREVVWPSGQYKTTGTITCGPLSSTRASGGAVLTYTGTGTAFQVQGVNTSETNGQFHVLPYINRSALDWNSGADTTSIGMLLQNRKYNTFVVPGVKRFNNGIALQCSVANFVCNTIQLGSIQNNRIGIDFSRVGGGYGINQNTFIGGACIIDSAYTSAANRIHIYMPNTENNTNTFVGVNLEKGGNQQAISCASGSNLFLNCRLEGGGTTAGYVTVSGNNNRFIGGAPFSSDTIPFVTWINDTGYGNTYQMANVIANKYMVWDTQSGSKPLLFGNGTAYPAVPIGPYGTDRLELGGSSTAGVRYYGYIMQEKVITTSGTTIPANQNQQLNYASPTTITNITGGFDQTVAGIFSLVDINGNITLTHTASPSAGAGRFVLKAGVNLAMTANQPVIFVLRDGNLYQV